MVDGPCFSFPRGSKSTTNRTCSFSHDARRINDDLVLDCENVHVAVCVASVDAKVEDFDVVVLVPDPIKSTEGDVPGTAIARDMSLSHRTLSPSYH
jgi:hypothetical protein